MTRANRYSPEVRERAVRMLHEQEPSYASRWAALTSIAGKIGCTPEALRKWEQRESTPAARCTVERLMKDLGLRGARLDIAKNRPGAGCPGTSDPRAR